MAFDARTLKRAGRPLDVGESDGLADGGNTIYHFRRAPGSERPELGQIDTGDISLIGPTVPFDAGISAVGVAAGVLLVANGPGPRVERRG